MSSDGTSTGIGVAREHPGAAALIQRWFDQVWNEANAESIDDLTAQDIQMWGISRPGTPSRGTMEFKTFYARIREAFPDTHIALEQVVQQGDTAFARWTATMTHTGEGLPVPPTNQALTICGMSACRVLHGKIVESWNVWDQMGMARQLGLLPGQIAEIFS
jgi:steroid delta-isomerase-like uncharacterized protein